METPVVQRWSERRGIYLPADVTIATALYEVEPIRKRDRGWRYAAALLERHGAERLGENDDQRAWLARWVPALTRTLRHGGNHVYLWVLDKRLRKRLPASEPYPKFTAQEAG